MAESFDGARAIASGNDAAIRRNDVRRTYQPLLVFNEAGAVLVGVRITDPPRIDLFLLAAGRWD